MRRILPPALALLILAGLIALFQLVRRYDPAVERIGLPSDTDEDISVRCVDASVVARRLGRTEWQLHADRIELRGAGGGELGNFRVAEFGGVRDGVFFRDGRPEARFQAGQALYEPGSHRFNIRDRIRLRTVKDERLEADACTWSDQDDYVRFPVGARGFVRGDSVFAPVLLFSPRKRRIECPRGADGRFNGFPLRADSLVWDLQREVVACPGLVSGERRQMSFVAFGVTLNLKSREFVANRGQAMLRIEDENAVEEGLR